MHIDTRAFYQALTDAGAKHNLATAIVKGIDEAMNSVVTTQYLDSQFALLDQKLDQIDQKIERLDQRTERLEQSMVDLERRFYNKLLTTMGITIAVLGVLIKLF